MNTQIPTIKEEAVFIADAHYKLGDDLFLDFISSLIASPPAQVFFMGDIFHLYIGHIYSSTKPNEGLLKLINELSEKTEVFYFEGNHDFGIDSCLMPKVKIYPRSFQPAIFKFHNKNFLLSHGDIFISKAYEFYITTLGSSLTLSLLRLLDRLSFGLIYHFIAKKINQKPIKNLPLEEKDFDDFGSKRLEQYQQFGLKHSLGKIDGVIEGHFHIGKNKQHYYSLPSFYCHKRAFVIQSKDSNTGSEI